MISHSKFGNSGKNPDLGSGGGLGGIAIVSFKKRVARKLRRIILLHFRLEPFRFHFGKTRKPFIFMVFGILDVPSASQTNHFKFSIHHISPNISRILKANALSKQSYFEISNSCTPNISKGLETTRTETSCRFVVFLFGNLEHGINIYQKA